MNKTNPKVDFYFKKANKWQDTNNKLRKIILESDLTEELKWGQPCYTHNNKNVVLIHDFKEYSALLFINGALLKDEKGILIQQTKNVQAARQIRFKNLQEIVELEPVIKEYLNEAIEVQKAGLKITHKETAEFEMPEELKQKLAEDHTFKAAFEALTPGRQRAYILYFAAPKQVKTREDRIEKYAERIFDGLGLND